MSGGNARQKRGVVAGEAFFGHFPSLSVGSSPLPVHQAALVAGTIVTQELARTALASQHSSFLLL